MITYSKQKSEEASITVFLSLILILILSLVMTVIEGARRSTAMVIAERAMTSSMDSVLAGFYGPLMEEYHLLGLDSSYGGTSTDNGEIARRMEDYMSYTFNPNRDLNEAKKVFNLYSNSLESVELISSTSLLDYQGEIFLHELTEYMKYRSVGDVLEFFLDKASLLEQPKKVSVLYEEKVGLEEKLVTIDEGILALMKYIDGVSTGRKGLIRKKGGGLKTEEDFIKRILHCPPTMESTGINNEQVFYALKDKYQDPTDAFNDITYSFERLYESIKAIDQLTVDLEHAQESIEGQKEALSNLEKSLSESKEADEAYKEAIMASIEAIENSISGIANRIDAIQQEIEAHKKEKANCIKTIEARGNDISLLTSGCLLAAERAVLEIDQIITRAEEAEPLIESYERSLEREKEGLDADVLDSLEEGLQELKRYQLNNFNGYDFYRMREILVLDYEVLTSCVASLNGGFEAMIDEDYSRAQEAYTRACNELLRYETKGLNINYSTLVIDDKDSPDYLDGMKELIKEGIVSLVIDPKTISDNEISAELLPSVIDMLTQDEESFSFTTLLKNMKIGGKNFGMDGLFGSFGEFSLGALVGSGVDEILERLLVQGYIKEHFYRFPVKEEEKKGRKPSVLEYEMEYLLYGKASDKENLEAFIGRIILIRTLLNFATILGTKEKWKEAKSIATLLVGFTGLPILVAITQGILMILLAFASGLVDTCALLIGKELPIIKKKVDLEYSDLLLLTRDNIKRKANAYKEGKGFSYNDYISLFLCLTNQRKLSYRMMDLIQENINIRYNTDFNLQNCIFGYEAKAKFHIKPLFTTFSFMNKYIGKDNGSPLIIQAECSY